MKQKRLKKATHKIKSVAISKDTTDPTVRYVNIPPPNKIRKTARKALLRSIKESSTVRHFRGIGVLNDIEKGLNDVIEAREQSQFSKRLVRRDIVERDVCIIPTTSEEILDAIREIETYFQRPRRLTSHGVVGPVNYP